MHRDDYSNGAGAFQLEDVGAKGSHLQRSGLFKPECYDQVRPTVAVLAIVSGTEVLLVQSSKRQRQPDVVDKPSWLIPQGEVPKTQSAFHAVATVLWQELGLEYSVPKLREMTEMEDLAWLGTYTNTRRENKKPKYILTAAMPLQRPERIKLQATENAKYYYVADQYELWQCLAHTRPVKTLGVMHAVTKAYSLGLIGWSCADAIKEYVQSLPSDVVLPPAMAEAAMAAV